MVPGEAGVHVDHFVAPDTQDMGHRIDGFLGNRVVVELAAGRLEPAQVEEKLLLSRGRPETHDRGVVEHIPLDRGTNPPDRVGREAIATLGIELSCRLDEADVSLGDQVGQRQAVAASPLGELDDEPQVTADQAIERRLVARALPALREVALLLGREHRVGADLAQVTTEAGYRIEVRDHAVRSSGPGGKTGRYREGGRDRPDAPFLLAHHRLRGDTSVH
jgi:hypothetical protein